jgi:hypothetical protein
MDVMSIQRINCFKITEKRESQILTIASLVTKAPSKMKVMGKERMRMIDE